MGSRLVEATLGRTLALFRPGITKFSSSALVKQADRRYRCTVLGSQTIKSQVYHNKHAIPYWWVTAIIEPMSHGH